MKARNLLSAMRAAGLLLAASTSFGRPVADSIFERLRWQDPVWPPDGGEVGFASARMVYTEKLEFCGASTPRQTPNFKK